MQYLLPGGGGGAPIPFCGSPMNPPSDGGTRYAAIEVVEQAARGTRYRTSVIRAKGDTIFSRIYKRQPIPVPRRFSDSVFSAWRDRARYPRRHRAHHGCQSRQRLGDRHGQRRFAAHRPLSRRPPRASTSSPDGLEKHTRRLIAPEPRKIRIDSQTGMPLRQAAGVILLQVIPGIDQVPLCRS